MPLVYLPQHEKYFLWGEETTGRRFDNFAAWHGEPTEVEIVAASSIVQVEGLLLPILSSVGTLGAMSAESLTGLPGSVVAWSLASKLALDLACRERMVPTLVGEGTELRARWRVSLSMPDDAAHVLALARSLPPSAHAVRVPGARGREVWAPQAILRAFLDATMDALTRAPEGGVAPTGRRPSKRTADDDPLPWEEKWEQALRSPDPKFDASGFRERNLHEDVPAWSEPALGSNDRLRACFRLEMPPSEEAPWVVRFLLQSPSDPSLLITASEVWKTKGRSLGKLGRAFRDPQESLLGALGRAAVLFPPIASGLRAALPEALELDPAAAWDFLKDGAPLLAEAGFGVIVPGELTAAGQRRLKMKMRVQGSKSVDGAVSGTTSFGLDEILSFTWEAALGEETLTAPELASLARMKAPLVRYRGEWVAIDPSELEGVLRRLAEGTGEISTREALTAALTGKTQKNGLAVSVSAEGVFAEFLARLKDAAGGPLEPPSTFSGTLRPYQARGLGWLSTMGTLGLGGCLADDMGLGKTVQLLAFLLHRLHAAPDDTRPTLLVAPTSVLGNWEREAHRFAPALAIVRHYGPERARSLEDIPHEAGTVVVTSFGLLRRDSDLLRSVPWGTVVLDEAQNIKNAGSATAKAARTLRASHRFALTGTPVENRLAELWSIFEFCNPGLLGRSETFRHDFAVPIERFGDDDAAERLRSVVSPFLLRRMKSDPSIIQDLPPKNEMKVVCTLTSEQASLYQAVVDEEMRAIEEADGIARRSRVLALLLFLKQICNHPAQFLGETGPLARRSGKLERISEMLEEVIAEGDKALVFTQFREMGDRLLRHLRERLGVEVFFLHGGTPRAERDRMVERFQEESRGPRVFVLSVKAGGTGLNLTAASHVFHFDRWWNPAVEDQATDRAYRIGQARVVQVHKFVCAGTVEEKVDHMLEQKRKLASKVVGAGEKWITELGNEDLRNLFSLAENVSVGDSDDDEVATNTAPRGRRHQGTQEMKA